MRRTPLVSALMVAALVVVSLCALPAAAGKLSLDNPPGPYVEGTERPDSRDHTFSEDDRLVATYYFYWYDNRTKAHVVTGSGHDLLTDHPPTLDGFSYKNVDWHKGELRDMLDAGIDVVLPVYWGNTASLEWSLTGLEKLVQACRELREEGVEPPRIGMFYDTTTLQFESRLKQGGKRPDLTTEFGKKLFYKAVLDFYSLIPPDLRARIDGRPIVWLYSAAFAGTYDQSSIEYLDRRFRRDFGGKDLYIVRERSWSVDTEDVYAWGAALGGPNFLGVICLGPGYDDSAVPGRTTPVQPRRDGEFYRESWRKALAVAALRDRNIVALETWNEYHEGTDIAASKEYGRRYIELTAEYVKQFKAGRIPEDYPGREYMDTSAVSTDFGAEKTGIVVIGSVADGKYRKVEKDGVACVAPATGTSFNYHCLYFQLNTVFKMAHDVQNYTISVVYHDSGEADSFHVEYDSTDGSALMDGAYKSTRHVAVEGTGQWKTARFHLTDARFSGRQNGGADFRIWTNSADFVVRSVSIELDSH